MLLKLVKTVLTSPLAAIMLALVAFNAFAVDVYVQPDGATGFTPTAPYDSWETAAANLHDAQHLFLDDTTVHLKEGQYSISSNLVIAAATTVIGEGYEKTAIVNTHAGRQGGNNNPLSKTRAMTISNAGAWIEGVRISGGWPCSSALGEDGGGIYMSAGVVTNCQISGNQTQLTNKKGCGVRILGGTLTHCRILNNTGNNNGSGTIYASGGATIDNCLVANNDAKGGGGGILIDGTAYVRNCTFVGNKSTSASASAGIHVTAGSSGEIRNCASAESTNSQFAGEGAPEWSVTGNNAQQTVVKKLFKNCAFGIPTGSDTIGVPNDTCFAFAPTWKDVDYHIGGSSPLVDKGISAEGDSDEDLDGEARIFNDIVDIGCYECADVSYTIDAEVLPTEILEGEEVTFTAKTGNEPDGVTFTWTLSAAGQDDIVFTGRCVTKAIGRAGYYDVRLESQGADPVLKKELLRVGAHTNYLVAAGTVGVIPTPPYADWATAATNVDDVLDAAMNGATVLVGPGTYYTRKNHVIGDLRITGVEGAGETVFANGQGAPGSGTTGYRVLALNHPQALLKGVTCRGGFERGGADGGGVLIDTLGGTVEDCVVCDNSVNGGSASKGAGIACLSTKGVIRRSIIRGNKDQTSFGGSGGGGVYLTAGLMEDCLVVSNSAIGAGGVFLSGGRMVNCTVVANDLRSNAPDSNFYAGRYAGGVYMEGGYVTNTLVVCNTSVSTNGVCSPEIAVAGDKYLARFANCGVMLPAEAPNESCVAAEEDELGFVDAASGNWRLDCRKSAFYKKGAYDAWMDGATDLDGRPRAHNRTRSGAKKVVDIGCYESDWLPPGMMLMVK